MFVRLRHLLGWVVSVFRRREELLLENLALRQQVLALHAKRPRPRLSSLDRVFWIVLRKARSGWKGSPVLPTPETVVCRLSAVLGLALTNSASRRKKAFE